MSQLMRNRANGERSLRAHVFAYADKALAAYLDAVERVGAAARIMCMIPEIPLRIAAVG